MNQSRDSPSVVGVIPWLPWPLSAWSCWTRPVRAERLALLRIGVALCLLVDISFYYAPEVLTYFAKGSLGDPAIFNWRFQAPRTTWTLLRGVGDSATVYLALTIWIATTGWILGIALARLLLIRHNPPPQDRTGIALMIWSFAFLWYVAGLWSRMVTTKETDPQAWVMPLIGLSLVCLFQGFAPPTRLRGRDESLPWFSILFALVTSSALLIVGITFSRIETIDPDAPWVRLLKPWQDDEFLLTAAMILWIACAVLLLIGCLTRFAAIATWLLSMSFANANPYLDNAGDTIRLILLFYLMLCPCGAVWSIDARWHRRSGPVYVPPWPICLIFTQMIFIYFMNGLYKLFGESWLDGSSLFYVLGDATLTRVSQVQWPIPYAATKAMTWSVLAWEVSFPLLVIWKWPRRFALVCGVLFHLGIFASMELAGFVPYALCMYLPLVPWERWFRPDVSAGPENR